MIVKADEKAGAQREKLAASFMKVQRYLRAQKGWSVDEIQDARRALHNALESGGEDLESAEAFYATMEREMEAKGFSRGQ